MGIPNISCRCIKSCRDSPNEVDLAKEDYLRSKSGNYKINNNPIHLEIYQKSRTQSSLFKTDNQNFEIDSKSENKNIKEKIKETVPATIMEDDAENKYLETNNNPIKTVTSFVKENNENNDNNIENEINFNNDDSKKEENNNNINENNNENNSEYLKVKFIPNFDRTYFFPKKLKNAEKNFLKPLDHDKDIQKYLKEDDENNDMLICINAIKDNKGINHTKEEGQVMEYKGEKYLFIGETDKNLFPQGLGILYTQGKKYEGNFIEGKLVGLGRYIDEEGTCYEGIFEKNKIISKATMIKINENNKKVEYFGDLVDFKKNGKGEETVEGEYRYKGDFKDDLWDGQGELENFLTGDIYIGHFDKGDITGKGKIKWKDGETYEGTFLKGIKHGKGVHKWPDKSRYKGEYINGIREGKGEYKWPDGRIFKGLFKNGKPDGKGKIHFKHKIIECEFKNGKPITDISLLFKDSESD